MLTSCKEKTWTVSKFLYFTVYGVTYDSLNNPHLGIAHYFEFNAKKPLIFAEGRIYSETEVAPINGLYKFYERPLDEESYNLIQETLANKDFDSTYNSHWEPRCCYFLYKTSEVKSRIITFGTNDSTPLELEKLMHYLNDLLEYQYRYKPVDRFSVDSMVLKLEKEMFSDYPPAPKARIE